MTHIKCFYKIINGSVSIMVSTITKSVYGQLRLEIPHIINQMLSLSLSLTSLHLSLSLSLDNLGFPYCLTVTLLWSWLFLLHMSMFSVLKTVEGHFLWLIFCELSVWASFGGFNGVKLTLFISTFPFYFNFCFISIFCLLFIKSSSLKRK